MGALFCVQAECQPGELAFVFTFLGVFVLVGAALIVRVVAIHRLGQRLDGKRGPRG